MSENDDVNLLAIKDSCEKIVRFSLEIKGAGDLFENEMVFDAVLMNFIVIGEAVSKISKSLKKKYNFVDWSKIKSFRNIIAHDYFGVDAHEVWLITNTHIPILIKDVDSILSEINPK